MNCPHLNPARWLRHSFALVALAVLGGCSEPTSTAVPAAHDPGPVVSSLVASTLETSETLVSATIGTAGGTLAVDGGHSIRFPAGALSATTTITAVRGTSRLEIDFGPEGLVFQDSALPVVTFNYTETGLTDVDAPRMQVVYTDGNGAILEVLATRADTTANTVQAQVRHFSTYALATD